MVTGLASACLLTDRGRAYCWGDNRFGAVGSGSDHDRVAKPTAVDRSGVLAGVRLEQLALTSDWSTAVCGRSVAGRVFCWGHGVRGLLGDGTFRIARVPVRMSTDTGLAGRRVTGIAGTNYTFFMTTEPRSS